MVNGFFTHIAARWGRDKQLDTIQAKFRASVFAINLTVTI